MVWMANDYLNSYISHAENGRSIRELPHAHYKMRVESFSLLLKLLGNIGIEKYESRFFEIDGYKWSDSKYLLH